MSRSRKTQAIGDVIAEQLADKFAEKANSNRFWINKRDKTNKKAPLHRVGRGLDIDALNAQFDDDHFFNVWMDIEDCNEEEQTEMVNEVVDAFYGTGYYIGTKYPFTSDSGDKVSLAILASS